MKRGRPRGFPDGRWRVAPPKNAKLPALPGLYAVLFNGITVYIGQSKNISRRITQHRADPWFRLASRRYTVTWKIRPTAVTRLLAVEARLIHRLTPEGNGFPISFRYSEYEWHGKIIAQQDRRKGLLK